MTPSSRFLETSPHTLQTAAQLSVSSFERLNRFFEQTPYLGLENVQTSLQKEDLLLPKVKKIRSTYGGLISHLGMSIAAMEAFSYGRPNVLGPQDHLLHPLSPSTLQTRKMYDDLFHQKFPVLP